MPHLCLITQVFPPEIGAASGRLSELAERLLDLGWTVEVLTALPNYPTGKIFPGYDSRRPHSEVIGRVRVIRVPLYVSNLGFVRRLRCYLSFVRSACRWGPRLCRQPDLIYIQSPPLFSGIAAARLSRKWGCPFVLNVSDLWPDSGAKMGAFGGGVAQLASLLERYIYSRSSGITGQSKGIIETVSARAPGKPTELILNGVELGRFREGEDEGHVALLGPEPGPIFMYAGLFGLAQGLGQLLEIARSIDASVPGRFVLIGDGPTRPHLEQELAEQPNHRVRLVDSQPRDRIPQLLAAADVAVISLGYSIPGAVPSKIYEAMASALPILLIADGEPASIVRDAKCGLAIPPGNIEAATKAFRQLAMDPPMRIELGLAGRRFAEQNLSRELQAARLDSFLRGRLVDVTTKAGVP